jgi:hypothetical protein
VGGSVILDLKEKDEDRTPNGLGLSSSLGTIMEHYAREYLLAGVLGGVLWAVLLRSATHLRRSWEHRILHVLIILLCWAGLILLWLRVLSIECWYPPGHY